ncbi:MAG: hypothetical protein WD294_06745 [Phycisphaeraceae bacterium]
MTYHLWRRFRVLSLVLAIGVLGVNLAACEQEPDNGVMIEEDNGVEGDIDAPGDEESN